MSQDQKDDSRDVKWANLTSKDGRVPGTSPLGSLESVLALLWILMQDGKGCQKELDFADRIEDSKSQHAC